MNQELRTAYEVLKNIYSKQAFSQIELNRALTLSQANHGLVTKIVYGVLENDLLLTYFITPFFKKKPKLSVLIILKMGAYVSHMLNSIPPFALVNELVNLAKMSDRAVAGFVNATLKNIINSDIKLPDKLSAVTYLSVKYSYPEWLVKNLLATHDEQFVENLLAHELTHFTHVRVNLNETTESDFEKHLNDHEITHEPSLLKNAFYVDYEALLKAENLQKEYVVLGLTSMNVVESLSVQNNAKVLDTCASPGGKSLYLSQRNPSLSIVAADLYPHRVQLIEKLIAKYGAKQITPMVNDATKFNEQFSNRFDLVLCDVPCSGIGVVGKKPDILLNRKASDIPILTQLQSDILNTSASYVKTGGQLVYSTCTLLRQENQDVVFKFLQAHPEFELIPFEHLNDIACQAEQGMITYYPNISNTEGFFMARLLKKE